MREKLCLNMQTFCIFTDFENGLRATLIFFSGNGSKAHVFLVFLFGKERKTHKFRVFIFKQRQIKLYKRHH